MGPKRVAMTPAERAAANAAKRARIQEEKVAARQAGWRLVNKTEECFYPSADLLPPKDQYMRFNIRNSFLVTRFSIFRRFVTDELMTKVMERWNFKDLIASGIGGMSYVLSFLVVCIIYYIPKCTKIATTKLFLLCQLWSNRRLRYC